MTRGRRSKNTGRATKNFFMTRSGVGILAGRVMKGNFLEGLWFLRTGLFCNSDFFGPAHMDLP
jgi:hypothetical protein